MRSAPPALAYCAVLAAALILGFNPVAMKLIYALPAGMGPLQFIASRPVWCLVMYLAVAAVFRPRGPIVRADWWKFALLGVCYGPGTGGLLPLGVSLTSATHTVLLYALGPPLTGALGALLLREPLPLPKAAAMVIGVAGAVVVTAGGARGQTSSLLGDALVTGMVVATAVQALVLRRLSGQYAPLFIASLYGAIGSVMLLLVTLPLVGVRYVPLPLHLGAVGMLLFFGEIVLGVSLLAQALQSLALHALHAALVSALLRYGSLFAGTILAFWLLNERASITEFAGGALLAGAVALSLMPDGRVRLPVATPHLHPDFHPLH